MMGPAMSSPCSYPHRIVGILLASATLAGCALGPRPVPPAPTVPAQWNNPVANQGEWPSDDWWSAFDAPELERLITDAQSLNTDIAQAQARLVQADAQARIAGAALLPTVALQPGASTIRSLSPTGTLRRYSPLLGVASASYEIDLWGKLHDARRSAIANGQAARFSIAVVRLGVTSSVAATYFQLCAVQDKIADAKNDVLSATRILEGLRIQQQHGLVTGMQLAQQTALVAQFEAAIAPLEIQRTHLADALAILSGHTPEEIAITGGSLETVKIPHVASGLPADLLLRRPDVQEAERLLAAANANISVARKNFLPSIALTGTGGAQSVALASAVGAPAAIFNFGLSTLQPIFSGGRLRGSLDYANGRYAELAAGYARAVQQALGDTEDALATVSGEDIEMARRTQALAASRNAAEMARKGLEGGLTDTLPLLLAQQSLASAHSSYIDARLNRVLGAVALYKALGGGWQKP